MTGPRGPRADVLKHRERVLSVLERQFDWPAQPVRFEDGDDHLGGRPAVVDAATGLAILANGRQEFEHSLAVARVVLAIVERLGLADAGAGDGFPFGAA